ncbi:MAG: polysaccharide biosynthesis tyrosine autokinase [Gemmatimonadaceae bacterium]
MSPEFPIAVSPSAPVNGVGAPRPNAWSPEPPDESQDAGAPIARVIGALLRYKWLTFGLVVLGGVLGAMATQFIRPTYEARAKLWVLSMNPTKAVGGPIRADELLPQNSWVELFQSFAITDSVVAKRGLAATPSDPKDRPLFLRFAVAERPIVGDYQLAIDARGRHFSLSRKKDGVVVDTGSVGDSIGRPVGFRWVPPVELLTPGRATTFNVITPRDASNQLLGMLKPPPMLQPNGNFMTVALTGSDPVEAAATLNIWIDEFVYKATSLKKQNVSAFSQLLESQLGVAGDRLRTAERALEGFRVNAITLPSENMAIVPGVMETRNPVLNQYFNKRMEFEELHRNREALSKALSAGAGATDAITSIPNVATLPGAKNLEQVLSELQLKQNELRAKQMMYTDEHAQVKELKKKVADLRTEAVPLAGQGLLRQLQAREADLNKQLSVSSSELRGIPARTIEEQRLIREKSVAEQLYANLQQRYAEAKLSESSAMADVTALDRASPANGPATFQKIKLVGTAILLALALGLGLSVLLDRLDHKFRHLAQISSELGLSVLGTVPKIVQPPRRAKPEDAAEVIESFRGIRLRLQYAYSASQPLICGVTSPEQGDGKSLVASNLALAFAEAGYKTLLIDADTRRGALHEVFGVQRRPGLIEILSGEVPRADVLQATSQERLTLLPCGGRRTTNPELVASAALPRLLRELVQEFSVVIVDGPPLSAGIDAFAIGAACENTLLVLRHAKTDMRMARAKLNLLRRLPLRTVGVVLNDVRSMGDYKYYGYDATYRALPEERAVATV